MTGPKTRSRNSRHSLCHTAHAQALAVLSKTRPRRTLSSAGIAAPPHSLNLWHCCPRRNAGVASRYTASPCRAWLRHAAARPKGREASSGGLRAGRALHAARARRQRRARKGMLHLHPGGMNAPLDTSWAVTRPSEGSGHASASRQTVHRGRPERAGCTRAGPFGPTHAL